MTSWSPTSPADCAPEEVKHELDDADEKTDTEGLHSPEERECDCRTAVATLSDSDQTELLDGLDLPKTVVGREDDEAADMQEKASDPAEVSTPVLPPAYPDPNPGDARGSQVGREDDEQADMEEKAFVKTDASEVSTSVLTPACPNQNSADAPASQQVESSCAQAKTETEPVKCESEHAEPQNESRAQPSAAAPDRTLPLHPPGPPPQPSAAATERTLPLHPPGTPSPTGSAADHRMGWRDIKRTWAEAWGMSRRELEIYLGEGKRARGGYGRRWEICFFQPEL